MQEIPNIFCCFPQEFIFLPCTVCKIAIIFGIIYAAMPYRIVLSRRGAETQRFISNTENSERTETFVYYVSSVFRKILMSELTF